MADQDDSTYAAAPSDTLPEKIDINGVTYVRQRDWIDERVNQIAHYQEIARRTGLNLRQVFWFQHGLGNGTVLPD